MITRYSRIAAFVILLLCLGGRLQAQVKVAYQFIDARELTVLGQSDAPKKETWHRVAAADQKKLPKRVAELSQNSAGINVLFRTNAKHIRIKWVLGKYNQLWNMTPLAVNGMDLYGMGKEGWQYVASARPVADSNDALIIGGLDGQLRHYRLYLPLYAEVKKLEVGVDSGAMIVQASPEHLPQKSVVIYGSSITQGASASRPGMAYPALLSRRLGVEIFNMGFSGSGKMELPVADVLASMRADVYVLDCVPNPTPEEIRARAVPFIKRLRALKPATPIVLVESIIREDSWWSGSRHERVLAQNQAYRDAYEQLAGEGYKGLYYIPAADLIGHDHEATIDGTHLTDAGFLRIASQIGPVLEGLLK